MASVFTRLPFVFHSRGNVAVAKNFLPCSIETFQHSSTFMLPKLKTMEAVAFGFQLFCVEEK